MRYLETYNFIFRHVRWKENVLFAAICTIIPIIGPMAMWGYVFELIDYFLDHDDDHYPVFDFSRFVDYLKRGVWPFLANLIVGLMAIPFSLILMIFIIAISAIADGSQDPETEQLIAFAVIIPVSLIGGVVLALVNWILIVPCVLGTGLTGSLSLGFRPSWIGAFLRRVWKEVILAGMFLVVTSQLWAVLGLCMCFVGIYAVAAIVTLAQGHFFLQLYRLYLTRGGGPIGPSHCDDQAD